MTTVTYSESLVFAQSSNTGISIARWAVLTIGWRAGSESSVMFPSCFVLIALWSGLTIGP